MTKKRGIGLAIKGRAIIYWRDLRTITTEISNIRAHDVNTKKWGPGLWNICRDPRCRDFLTTPIVFGFRPKMPSHLGSHRSCVVRTYRARARAQRASKPFFERRALTFLRPVFKTTGLSYLHAPPNANTVFANIKQMSTKHFHSPSPPPTKLGPYGKLYILTSSNWTLRQHFFQIGLFSNQNLFIKNNPPIIFLRPSFEN